MRSIRTMAVATVAIVALAAACGSVKKPTSSAEAGGAATGASSGASSSSGGATGGPTFTYASQNSIVTELDPGLSYSNESLAMSNIYEQLTRYDSQTKTVKPLLATKWVSADGGKQWTFTLRSGVTFHTGRALTAQAAKAAILRTKATKAGAAYIWDSVKTIDTPNPTTLVFHLSYPAPLDLISSSGYAAYIYDTKAAPSASLTKWFDTGKDAGTGPYTIAKWNKGQENELRLSSYPKYWGGWAGPHYTSALFKFVPAVTTMAQLLQSGEVTFAEQLTPQLFAQAKTQPNIATEQGPSFQNLIAMLNTASGPLKDVRVRKAVGLAVDYNGIIAALKGSAVPAHGFIPEGLIGYDPSLVNTQNMAEAKSILGAAGYGPGKKKLSLSLTLSNGDANEALVASIVKSDLAQLNISVNVQPLEWSTQWNRAKSTNTAGRQDIFVMYWYPDYADAYSWFINLFRSGNPPSFNLSYYDNPALDKQIDGIEALTASNRDAAAASYTQMQKEIAADAVALPLYVVTYQHAFAKSMTGYVDNPAYADVVFIHDLKPTG